MLETFFLTYVNNSFKDDPENLNLIYKEILPFLDSDRAEAAFISMVIKHVIEYAKYSGSINYLHRKLKKEFSLTPDHPYRAIAFESVYGYRDGYCEKECCITDKYLKEILKNVDIAKKGNLKCFECQQLVMAAILNDIVEGKPYYKMVDIYTLTGERIEDVDHLETNPNIKLKYEAPSRYSTEDIYISDQGFRQLLNDAYSCIRSAVISNGDVLKKIETITTQKFFTFPCTTEISDLKHVFTKFLTSLFAYSLIEFLIRDDRKKLKKCKECGHYYISKTLRASTFCSDKCRLKYHNREYSVSGKSKEYIRRGRLEGKYQ